MSSNVQADILRGVDKLAEPARTTLGPGGQDVTIETQPGVATTTRDGLTVVRKVTVSDPTEKLGAKMVRKAAEKTFKEAGDGSTTAALLAQAIYRRGAEGISAGIDPAEIRRGIQRAVQVTLQEIDRISRPLKIADVAHVGTTSAHNDEAIGQVIAEAVAKVGLRGLIAVEADQGPGLRVEKDLRSGQIAVIRVGGATAVERRARKARVKTALRALQAADEQGIVPGGGVALLRAIAALKGLKASGGEKVGIEAVRHALKEPALQIVLNAGKKGPATVQKVISASGSTGYNAATGRHEDLMAAGVVDPAKVTKTALRSAALAVGDILISGSAPEPAYRVGGRDWGSYGLGGDADELEDSEPWPSVGQGPKGYSSAETREVRPKSPPQPSLADKRISVWIDKQEAAPKPPLAGMLTLNFKVGLPVAASLVDGAQTRVPLADIPEEGLATEWVVGSSNVLLAPTKPGIEVRTKLVGGSLLWQATFPLLIPRDGESETVQLLAQPQAAVGARLDVLVYARGALYRQLEVELRAPAGGAARISEGLAASVSSEMTYRLPGEIGVRPAQDWARPTGNLEITVGSIRAHVKGKAQTPEGSWEPNEWVDWPPKAQVADRVEHVRDVAENFREAHTEYLDDLPPEDFARRLGSRPGAWTGDWSALPDRAGKAHQKAWATVAVSPELFALAYRGHALYQALFPKGSELRKGMDGLRPGTRLDVNWLDSIGEPWISHVPWGLMYLEEPGMGQPVDPMKFLGLRHRIGYVPYQVSMPPGALGRPNLAWTANFLYWGDDLPGTEARWQRQIWGGWPNQLVLPGDLPVSEAKKRFSQVLKKPEPQPMSVLYFFCRSAEGKGKNDLVLRFANSAQPPDNLGQIEMGQDALADRPFVFANACSTAAADPYIANALERTFIKDRQCRAFLGTEAKVPIVLASRFAAAFFHLFYRHAHPDPVAAGEAVAQTRLFLWTQYRNLGGLFYCLINKYDLYMADESEIRNLQT